jgi:hypothetical protein
LCGVGFANVVQGPFDDEEVERVMKEVHCVELMCLVEGIVALELRLEYP